MAGSAPCGFCAASHLIWGLLMTRKLELQAQRELHLTRRSLDACKLAPIRGGCFAEIRVLRVPEIGNAGEMLRVSDVEDLPAEGQFLSLMQFECLIQSRIQPNEARITDRIAI